MGNFLTERVMPMKVSLNSGRKEDYQPLLQSIELVLTGLTAYVVIPLIILALYLSIMFRTLGLVVDSWGFLKTKLAQKNSRH